MKYIPPYFNHDFKSDLHRYFRFIFGGGLSLMLNLFVTYVLTEFFHFWHMVSFSLALGMEIAFLFVYHSLITFRQRGKFFRFVFIILGISGLNWLGVYFLSVILGIQYLISIVIAALLISVLNYSMNKKWVFGEGT